MSYKMSYEEYLGIWLKEYVAGEIPSYEVPMTKERYEKGGNKMTGSTLKVILEKHEKWLNGEDDGERANLSGKDLRFVELKNTNLSIAILDGVDLSGVDLSDTDLTYATLSRANLSYANLSCANLSNSDLTDADLTGADLTGTIFKKRS